MTVLDGLLDFFVIGAQKAGTTALDSFLRSHPEIEMGRRKELHYFDDDRINWHSLGQELLMSSYNWSRPGVVRGEATPIYMYWPLSLERLHAYNRNAKLIVLLRHPPCRAYSHWKMETARGNEKFPFKLAIADVGRMRLTAEPGGVHRVYSYVERGFYARQIASVLRLFPARNVHFLRTDELWRASARSLAGVAGFLGIDAHPCWNSIAAYVSPVHPVNCEPMPEFERPELDAIYHDDIAETARLSGLDLSDWTDPGYCEPMRPGVYPLRVGLAA